MLCTKMVLSRKNILNLEVIYKTHRHPSVISLFFWNKLYTYIYKTLSLKTKVNFILFRIIQEVDFILFCII